MAECKVTCYSGCRNDRGDGPKVWRYLCEECAEEKLEQHRREGCSELHLAVTREGSVQDLRGQIRRAGDVLIRQGW